MSNLFSGNHLGVEEHYIWYTYSSVQCVLKPFNYHLVIESLCYSKGNPDATLRVVTSLYVQFAYYLN